MIRKNKGLAPSSSRGFTLIELLVVIAIIGILSSVVLASLNSAREKGRDAKRLADIKQIQLALEMYYDDKSLYPSGLSLLTPAYLPGPPKDPLGTNYNYAALGGASCTSYHLGTSLEQNIANGPLTTDVDAGSATAVCPSGGTDFPGADADKCVSTDEGKYCYDMTP